jgi:uncharacterized protein (UPF0261 family)
MPLHDNNGGGDMRKTIAIVGTLDTKGEEIGLIKRLIEGKGHKSVIIDGGVMGKAPFSSDITREEVAKAAGMNLEKVRSLGKESEAITKMAEGASLIVRELYEAGELDGIISIGGSMGTSLGLATMRDLPVGFPKLMVSTIAFTPIVTGDVVARDQVMMQTPVDFWGLNVISRCILESAAGAIAGMAETYKRLAPEKPMIAVTTRGIMKYVDWIKPMLEARGYEVVVFHAVGAVGGKTFEKLIRQGLFVAALDLCTGEVIEELYGGALKAGPERLEAAGELGIPQIVAPGCMEFWHWPGTVETAPRDRRIHVHNPMVIGVLASLDEMTRGGEVMAEKLNRAKGPVTILYPLAGFDVHDRPGGSFYYPEGRTRLLEVLKAHIGSKIRLVELDAHINDQAFAEAVVAEFEEIYPPRKAPSKQ